MSPADDIVLTKTSILVPQVAHLTFMPYSLLSFLRKAESIPNSGHDYCAVCFGISFAPALFAVERVTTSLLSR